MSTSSRRKHISLMAQLHAALRQLGFEPHEVELDHSPALALRAWNPETNDTIPPASDPRYLVWRTKAEHRVKTFGRPATTAGSDIGEAARLKRLERDTAEYRTRLLAKTPGRPRPKSKRWAKRSFARRAKRVQQQAAE